MVTSRCAAAFVAAVFVIAACGSDDGATTPATTTAVGSVDAVESAESECPPVEGASEQTRQFDAAPPDCLEPGATYEAVVTTNKGEFTISLATLGARFPSSIGLRFTKNSIGGG